MAGLVVPSARSGCMACEAEMRVLAYKRVSGPT